MHEMCQRMHEECRVAAHPVHRLAQTVQRVLAEGWPMRETGWRDVPGPEAEAMATPEDHSDSRSAASALTERYRADHPLS
jgi:hypothetical protein